MDSYELVTNRIISELEKGRIPWKQPWHGTYGAISHVTGKPYSLLNQIMLGEPGEYITFKQATQEGGHVKKGEKGKYVVFWKWLENIDQDTGEVKLIPYLRHYTVFHINQCEGINAKFIASQPYHSDLQPIEAAENVVNGYVARSGITFVQKESNEAYYDPTADKVVVPCIDQYEAVAEYYSTVFHELTHSTGHSSRLDRLESKVNFGDKEYSKQELVAECGASYLVNIVGLETPESFTNNAAYIQAWLKVLKNDKRLIVSAASKAEKAAKYILGSETTDDQGDEDNDKS